jgi:hypothetical protein
MPDRHATFVKILLLAALAGVAGVAAMNVLVDPAGAFPRVHLKLFEKVRYLDLDRVARAEMAARGDWQVIVLGSSRAEAGLPAGHPFFTTNRACNLSLAGAMFPELEAEFDFAQQHNNLEHVILCLDFFMFSKGAPWVDNFSESKFNSNFDRFPYYCRRLLGRAAIDRSWDAVRRTLQGYRPVPQQTRGFRNNWLGADVCQRELFGRVLYNYGAGYRLQIFAPSYLEQFRHIVRVCHDQRIDLRVAIMPVHALDLELVYASGHWKDFEDWKLSLVKVLGEEGVEGKFNLWDFTSYAGMTAEPVPPAGDCRTRMKYYFENSHCTPLLGGLMLDAMLRGKESEPANADVDPPRSSEGRGEPGFGVRLTKSNVQQELARILQERTVYALTNADDIAWVQRIVADAAQH